MECKGGPPPQPIFSLSTTPKGPERKLENPAGTDLFDEDSPSTSGYYYHYYRHCQSSQRVSPKESKATSPPPPLRSNEAVVEQPEAADHEQRVRKGGPEVLHSSLEDDDDEDDDTTPTSVDTVTTVRERLPPEDASSLLIKADSGAAEVDRVNFAALSQAYRELVKIVNDSSDRFQKGAKWRCNNSSLHSHLHCGGDNLRRDQDQDHHHHHHHHHRQSGPKRPKMGGSGPDPSEAAAHPDVSRSNPDRAFEAPMHSGSTHWRSLPQRPWTFEVDNFRGAKDSLPACLARGDQLLVRHSLPRQAFLLRPLSNGAGGEGAPAQQGRAGSCGPLSRLALAASVAAAARGERLWVSNTRDLLSPASGRVCTLSCSSSLSWVDRSSGAPPLSREPPDGPNRSSNQLLAGLRPNPPPHQGFTLIRDATTSSMVDIPTYLRASLHSTSQNHGVEIAARWRDALSHQTAGLNHHHHHHSQGHGQPPLHQGHHQTFRVEKGASGHLGHFRREPTPCNHAWGHVCDISAADFSPGSLADLSPNQKVRKQRHRHLAKNISKKKGRHHPHCHQHNQHQRTLGNSSTKSVRKAKSTVLCISLALLTMCVTLVGTMLSVGSQYQEMVIARHNWEVLSRNKSQNSNASSSSSSSVMATTVSPTGDAKQTIVSSWTTTKTIHEQEGSSSPPTLGTTHISVDSNVMNSARRSVEKNDDGEGKFSPFDPISPKLIQKLRRRLTMSHYRV